MLHTPFPSLRALCSFLPFYDLSFFSSEHHVLQQFLHMGEEGTIQATRRHKEDGAHRNKQAGTRLHKDTYYSQNYSRIIGEIFFLNNQFLNSSFYYTSVQSQERKTGSFPLPRSLGKRLRRPRLPGLRARMLRTCYYARSIGALSLSTVVLSI